VSKKLFRTSKRVLASFASGFLLLAGLHAQDNKSSAPAGALEQLSASVQNVVTKVSPAIVRLEVTGYNRSDEGMKSETHLVTKSESIASGVILEPDGYIVTNAHALEGARRIRIVLDAKAHAAVRGAAQTDEYSGAMFEARIIGIFTQADLALLKIDATGLPVLQLADSNSVRPGQLVFAVGNPEGLNNSVSMGVVSAVARQSEEDRPAVYIQTDAAINGGSSGGALVDIYGNLVGITSFILTEGGGSEGLGFALPSRLVYLICRELKTTGHFRPGEIGLTVQGITATIAAGLGLRKNSGLIVSDVLPNSPAASAGIQVQDIVLSADANAMDTVAQFATMFYTKHRGERVQLQILRGSRSFTAIVPVLDGSDDPNDTPTSADNQKSMLRSLCITAASLNEKTRSATPEMRSISGVVVVDKLAQCEMRTSIEPGDIIRTVNNVAVDNVESLRSQLQQFKPGDALVLQVERHKKLRYLAFEFD
jgi:serine protease Do